MGTIASSPTLRRRALRLAVLGLLPLACSGCATLQKVRQVVFGPSDYLFYGFDQVAYPGEEVTLQARVQRGPYFIDQSDLPIRFLRGDTLLGTARTNHEGVAQIKVRAGETGDKTVLVRAECNDREGNPMQTDLLLAVRPRDVPIVLVDMDMTMTRSGFEKVLLGEDKPMKGSARVLERIDNDYLLIYFTLRPDYLGPMSKRWIREYDYPQAPLWGPRFEGFLDGNKDWRVNRIDALRKRFSNVRWGIGDKVTDSQAYLAHGLEAIMFVHVQDIHSPHALRSKADELDVLPEKTHVVQTWEQVEQIIYAGASFPVSRTQILLRDKARGLDRDRPSRGSPLSRPGHHRGIR